MGVVLQMNAPGTKLDAELVPAVVTEEDDPGHQAVGVDRDVAIGLYLENEVAAPDSVFKAELSLFKGILHHSGRNGELMTTNRHNFSPIKGLKC